MTTALLPFFRQVFFICALGSFAATAADQPQWGHAWTRNMVSPEKNLPATFDTRTGSNVVWSAKIGNETHSTPVVARGKVFIGTNNGEPRDPKHQGDRGVLMCFNEADGKLLWQLVVPKRHEDPYFDWPKSGIASPATVDGDRVYIVSNRGEVICLDIEGLANGNDGPFKDEGAHMTAPPSANDAPKAVAGAEIRPQPLEKPAKALEPGPTDADIIWILDLVADAGTWPHDGAHSSILVHGDYLYLNTATGVDNTHRRIRTPDAPSIVVIDKKTGKLIARDHEQIAPNIFHSTWSSPSLAMVKGKPLIFFGAGNGTLYAFETIAEKQSASAGVRTLKKVFEYDFDPSAPRTNVHRFTTNRREGPSNIYGMPVFLDDRLYVTGGGDLWWGKNEAWLKCIDATRTGNVTTNATLWVYPLEKHVMSTAAVQDNLVYVADCGRTFHCVDATNGKGLWTHEIKGEVWASPMIADGKVYLGTRSGDFYVFAHAHEKKLLHTASLGSPISATTTPANGSLYVATMTHLYRIR